MLPLRVYAALAVALVRPGPPARADWGRRVSESALWYLQVRPALQRNDCSGLVQAVLGRAGFLVEGNARSLYAEAERQGRLEEAPQPGDLAFFDRTYDQNRNGRVDDTLTHVAVVTNVLPDGTVELVHRGGHGIAPLHLHLGHRDLHRLAGRLFNDFLRKPGYGGTAGPRLAGQLLRGFARPPTPAQ